MLSLIIVALSACRMHLHPASQNFPIERMVCCDKAGTTWPLKWRCDTCCVIVAGTTAVTSFVVCMRNLLGARAPTRRCVVNWTTSWSSWWYAWKLAPESKSQGIWGLWLCNKLRQLNELILLLLHATPRRQVIPCALPPHVLVRVAVTICPGAGEKHVALVCDPSCATLRPCVQQ